MSHIGLNSDDFSFGDARQVYRSSTVEKSTNTPEATLPRQNPFTVRNTHSWNKSSWLSCMSTQLCSERVCTNLSPSFRCPRFVTLVSLLKCRRRHHVRLRQVYEANLVSTAVTASRSSASVSAAEVDRRCKIREQRLKIEQRPNLTFFARCQTKLSQHVVTTESHVTQIKNYKCYVG
ncbi:uncharacterized protein PHALS_11588 [Plasmopara halstedii]|uniref:Uncharacterized protein n=1 Tax=Plasmopara halstedii TaxID=4781 RepID=A0A0P1AIR1_PLAHL|nr:uncharacterized protein PHALS_11588 [Plasmopara halstedii]CEG41226.1 hypothetical protein PHALS_11588 [Plasmopara halstedii]|eukprot:XP_024577595.1 hypothetical protein PHALS_11588 [Plasmopara halstedii]